MHQAIENNDPIESSLHVIIVVSNPCQYARRFILAREFIKRTPNVYIVELAHGQDDFQVTEKNNPKHLQIRTRTAPLWHKENMVNLGVKLLPSDWKAMAWVDADIEFENNKWAEDTLRILNGSRDVVQLWSHAVDMDSKEDTMQIFESFGYRHVKQHEFGKQLWHPGFAWACTKHAWKRSGGLIDWAILGSADRHMAMAMIGQVLKSAPGNIHTHYKALLEEFQERVKGLTVGYTPGTIIHQWHGSLENRRYKQRWEILTENSFDPFMDIGTTEHGVIELTKRGLRLEPLLDAYFVGRQEDS